MSDWVPTKREAVERANALKRLMKTKGWRIRVWSNTDKCWHWAIENPWMTVYERKGGKYIAFMNSDGNYSVGDCPRMGRGPVTSHNPNAAVTDRIKNAEEFAKTIATNLDSAKLILGL